MAVESIGTIYSVNIPGLTDAADIQAAFQAYHYGAYTSVATTAGIAAGSMAYWLKEIETDIALLEARPSSGGDATTSAPVAGDFTPSGIPDGYIWVDIDGAMTSSVIGSTAIYNNEAPTSGLTGGVIWVDKDATTSTSGNPFIPLGMINNKGDIFVGSTSNTIVILESALTSGYFLKTDTSTTSGLIWDIAVGDLTAISSGTGITVTNGAGPIVTVGIDTATTVDLNTAQTLTNKTFSFSSNTVTTTLAQLNSAVSDANVASIDGTETLTNKTLTGPNLHNPSSTSGTFVAPTIQNPSVTSGTFIAGTFTSSPAINSPIITGTTTIAQIKESTTVSATAATGTVNYDVLTNGPVTYYTSNAGANWTLNMRGSATTSMLNMLSVGESLTIAFLVTQGATAYYQSALQVDGSAVTPKWQGGTAPSSGNASSIDAYNVTITKVANTSTVASAVTVFESQTRFA